MAASTSFSATTSSISWSDEQEPADELYQRRVLSEKYIDPDYTDKYGTKFWLDPYDDVYKKEYAGGRIWERDVKDPGENFWATGHTFTMDNWIYMEAEEAEEKEFHDYLNAEMNKLLAVPSKYLEKPINHNLYGAVQIRAGPAT